MRTSARNGRSLEVDFTLELFGSFWTRRAAGEVLEICWGKIQRSRGMFWGEFVVNDEGNEVGVIFKGRRS